jgi:hypothetical protein
MSKIRMFSLGLLAVFVAGTAAIPQAFAQSSSREDNRRTLEQRAVTAAIWGMPIVSVNAMRQAFFRDAKANYNDIVFWSKPSDWKNQTTTPNASALYVYFKHLVLPPEYKGEAPAGYYPARSNTNLVVNAIRAMPTGGDMKGALDSLRRIRVYPLAQSANPPAYTFVDKTDQAIDASPLRLEDNIQYWEKLHKVLQEEPAFDEFRPMYGLLIALGIEHGKEFAPDARMKAILERAAKAGRDRLLISAYASSRPDRIVWTDRKWEWAALVSGNGDFDIDIEARDRWFSQATGASPKMFLRTAGAGSLYWLGLREKNGPISTAARPIS